MKKYLIALVVVLVVGGGVVVAKYGNFGITEKGDENLVATSTLPMACIEEAMQCPDGSYVGRSGPNCDFEVCPVDNSVKAPVITYLSSIKSTPLSGNGLIDSGELVYVVGKNLIGCTSVNNCEISVVVGGQSIPITSTQFSVSTTLTFKAPVLSHGTYDLYFLNTATGQKSNTVKVTYGGYIGQDQNTVWQTYQDVNLGYSVNYPVGYSISSQLKTTYSNSKSWYQIRVTDPTSKMIFLAEVNPDGYGPIFADKSWTVAKDSNNKISVVKEEILPRNTNSDDGQTVIMVNSVDNYDWTIFYPDNQPEFEDIARDMIKSFVLPLPISYTSCVEEGGSLGAVIPSNKLECCSGLIPLVGPNVVGSRGTCVKETSHAQ